MLNYVMQELAKMIAKDGEGASKLIEVNVKNAPNALDARMMAKVLLGQVLLRQRFLVKTLTGDVF